MSKIIALLAVLACALSTAATADEARAYKEGPVSIISFIKSKVILGYKIYQGQAHDPHDADLILSVTYANMAALDNLNDRTDAITEQLLGDRAKRNQKAADRESMREVLGSETVRELVLK